MRRERQFSTGQKVKRKEGVEKREDGRRKKHIGETHRRGTDRVRGIRQQIFGVYYT